MSRALKSLFALAAALAACACAQGRWSHTTSESHAPAALALAQTHAPTPSEAARPMPAAYAPPFPARERGADAFEPFVNLSGGRRFESRGVGRKPARKDLKVSADYPVLAGDAGPAAREFNRRVRSLVVREVTPYIEDGPDPEKEKDPHFKDVEEYHNVSHKVVFASDAVVSVLFYIEGYRWGAAHGFHQPVAFNFDLKAGREVKLARLFKPGSDYLRRMARLCAADLVRQREAGHIHGGGYSRPEDLKPTADSFKSWVVTPRGLVFIFEEYGVAPYSSGEPKVLVPFDALRDIIDPRGALAAVAAEPRP
jgi:hypothetical protein